MAEYYGSVFVFLYVINDIFRDMHEKNGVIYDTIVQLIST